MSEWAPVIHGRTYEVDFRPNLLVHPVDFTDKKVEWAKKYIDASMRSIKTLPRNPRWVLLKDKGHCIIGVTCMASQVSTDMTKDRANRPLYVFLGLVTHYPFSSVPLIDSAIFDCKFKPLYQWVRERWTERRSQAASQPKLSDYCSEHSMESFYSNAQDSSRTRFDAMPLELNRNHLKIGFGPTSEDEKIWELGCLHDPPMSICLRVRNQEEVARSPFLNATVLELDTDRRWQVIPKYIERTKEVRYIENSREVRRKKDTRLTSSQDVKNGCIPFMGLISTIMNESQNTHNEKTSKPNLVERKPRPGFKK